LFLFSSCFFFLAASLQRLLPRKFCRMTVLSKERIMCWLVMVM